MPLRANQAGLLPAIIEGLSPLDAE
jgi:hypothetical protein